MAIEEKLLKIISNDVKEALENMDVVTPSIYQSLFSEFAKKHNINLDEELEEQLSKNIIQDQCSRLTDLQSQTSQNAQKLSENTTRAIHAIKEQNSDSLQEVLQQTQALRDEIEKLKASVYKDELTHAYNRKWLHDRFLHNDSQFICRGVLALIDLNYFKKINDTYGHIIGDKVLIFITAQLKKVSKEVVRYGGDEFILLFRDVEDMQSIQRKIEQLRESILSKKLKSNGAEFHVSFSVGVTTFSEDDYLNSVIEDADKKMYEDKVTIKKRIEDI
jgi:diguanylate cyclase (GGDEF)-like protein